MLLEPERASCNAPIMPPGASEAASESCASFSQLVTVAGRSVDGGNRHGSDTESVACTLGRAVNEP